MDESARQIVASYLGRQPYEPLWRSMQRYAGVRDASARDYLLMLEHDPIFTLGQAGKAEHVLMPGDIPVLPVDRGGQVTYHGPGQLVAYPLIDLKRKSIGVRELVHRLEQVGIDLAAEFGISAVRRDGAPGIYVGPAKIMAIGIRVRRGTTFHGIAFNVDMDLEPFTRINPCGFRGLQVVDLKRLGVDIALGDFAAAYARQFAQVFDYEASAVVYDPNLPPDLDLVSA
jgi:lipoyl(octanoyl) transferase